LRVTDFVQWLLWSGFVWAANKSLLGRNDHKEQYLRGGFAASLGTRPACTLILKEHFRLTPYQRSWIVLFFSFRITYRSQNYMARLDPTYFFPVRHQTLVIPTRTQHSLPTRAARARGVLPPPTVTRRHCWLPSPDTADCPAPTGSRWLLHHALPAPSTSSRPPHHMTLQRQALRSVPRWVLSQYNLYVSCSRGYNLYVWMNVDSDEHLWFLTVNAWASECRWNLD
jgi:hypothetical protein